MKHVGTLTVCGSAVVVNEGDTSDREELGGCYGFYAPGLHEIWLHSELPKSKRDEVLVHEATHALIGLSGALDVTAAVLGLEREDPKMAKWEEAMVRVLTPHIKALYGTPRPKK